VIADDPRLAAQASCVLARPGAYRLRQGGGHCLAGAYELALRCLQAGEALYARAWAEVASEAQAADNGCGKPSASLIAACGAHLNTSKARRPYSHTHSHKQVDRRQPVGEHRGENVDHLPIAVGDTGELAP